MRQLLRRGCIPNVETIQMGGSKMKRLFASLALLMMASTVVGNVYVQGYYRQNGTYVRPHYRSDPDGDFSNNWSTYPNVNPYTGKIGTERTPLNSYGDSYFYHHGGISSDGSGGYSHSDGEGTSSCVRVLFVIVAIASFSSMFIKKDEEQKMS